jgi:hypothetical protein
LPSFAVKRLVPVNAPVEEATMVTAGPCACSASGSCDCDKPAAVRASISVRPDAVLPSAVALQCLELVARGHVQVVEHASPVQVQELPTGGPLDRPEPPDRDVVEEGLDVLVAKGANHVTMVLRMTSRVDPAST